jgi:hypothetical protein
MRRKPWFKSFATLLAVWFPLVVGEPSLLQPCATHGAVQATTDGHGGHGAPQAEASEHDPGTPDGTHHECTCIEGCCASFAAPTAPSAPETLVAALEPDAAPQYATVEALPRPGPEFSRPYNTGPPRA